MKLILIPLFLLIIIAFSVQFISANDIQTTYSGETGNYGDNEQLINLGIISLPFEVVAGVGFITFFTIIAGIGALSGLNIEVFGSTVKISEQSQKIIFNGLFYGGLWGIFSVLAVTSLTFAGSMIGLFSVPYGSIFYLILSLVFVIGIVKQINQT